MNDFFEDIDHIAEVCRTLRLFTLTEKKDLREREVVALANQTAGQIGRYPRPRAALNLARELGLVKFSRRAYVLTRLGQEYTEDNSTPEPTLKQNRLLFGLLIDNRTIRERLKDFLSHAESVRRVQVPQIALITIELRSTARLLQQLGCFAYSDGYFLLSPDFEDVITDLLLQSNAAISEDDLWRRLDKQRLRARYIEEMVVVNEQTRLKLLGYPELAAAVTRVSARDAGAGYDVASFDRDGSLRFIEVKSSVGRKLDFQWTDHEQSIAKKFGSSYWIYFVPSSHLVKDEISCLIRIRDPIKKLWRGDLRSQATAWSVRLGQRAADKIQPEIDRGTIIDW